MNARNGFENFFSVTKIELVLFVTRKLTAKRMEDRKNHGLVYYEKPYGKLTFGDKIITPQAGQIVYFPQGSSYDVSTEGAVETDGCHAINFLAPDLPAQEPFVFCPKAPQQIFPYFLRAEKAWKEKRPGYEEQCLSCLYAVIASLKSSSSYAPSGYGKLLFPAVEYIHENYTEKKLYGAELAALCGISETYFRRLFTGTYGVTPVEYANALKIGRAKDLLSERGDAKTKNREAYTISEIAELCGFSDVYYFSRLFKKLTGYSPDGWRKR